MIRGKMVAKNSAKNNIVINASIHNRFDVEVIDVRTGEIKQKAKAYNVITNNGWSNIMASGVNWLQYICFGSGTGTPSVSDTSLFTPIASKETTEIEIKSLPVERACYVKKKIVINENEYVGSVITEVGTGSPTSINTHAMLQDMNGNPISIEKTATDVINIYATIYLHYGALEDGYTFAMLNTKNNSYEDAYSSLFLFLLSKDTNNKFSLRVGFAQYKTVDASVTVEATKTVNVQNRRITFTCPRIDASRANINGIHNIFLGRFVGISQSHWVYSYGDIALSVGGSWYPYTQIENEAVGTGDGLKTDFSLDFSFAKDAHIYVDGVEDTSVTVAYRPKSATAIGILCEIDPASTKNNVIRKPYSGGIREANNYKYFINDFANDGYGIYSAYAESTGYGVKLCFSNDLENWSDEYGATSSGRGQVIPTEHRNKKFIKIWRDGDTLPSAYTYFPTLYMASNSTVNEVHFQTPPASGAVITATYKTETIAKDSNHVLDFSVTIQLGEHTET